jgi:hypothetical protein
MKKGNRKTPGRAGGLRAAARPAVDLVVAGGLAAVAPAHPAMMLAALFGVLPAAFGLATKAVLDRRQASARRFLDRVIDEFQKPGVTREEVLGLIESRAEQPNVQECIFEHVRALASAVSPAAAPPLALLFAEYARPADPRAPDVFFRGVTRALCDLGTDEFPNLLALIGPLVRSSSTIIADRARVFVSVNGTSCHYQPIQGPAGIEESIPTPPGAPRLIWLLKSHGLADDDFGRGNPEGRTGHGLMYMRFDVARRLGALLR